MHHAPLVYHVSPRDLCPGGDGGAMAEQNYLPGMSSKCLRFGIDMALRKRWRSARSIPVLDVTGNFVRTGHLRMTRSVRLPTG